jgi:hypothetical protein
MDLVADCSASARRKNWEGFKSKRLVDGIALLAGDPGVKTATFMDLFAHNHRPFQHGWLRRRYLPRR